MEGRMMAFFVWEAFGFLFVALGVYAMFSKRAAAFGFWANADMFPVKDAKGYNCALGKLWCVFGAVFALFGLPLVGEQNSPYMVITIVGPMLEVIAAMAVYVTVIERRYRQK